LGGWLTHGRSIDDSTTESIVHRAFELGINFFDTADVYHNGAAERSLAKAIKAFRREDLVIATKCFFPMSEAPNDRGLSRKHIVESVHNSLKRLEVDYIDLMQFHRFDPDPPMEEIVLAITDLIRQGKVLYWGTSEWKAHDIVDAVSVARDYRVHRPISNQPIYNMLTRGIEQSVIPAYEKVGVGQVVFSPLAQGVLTGKYLPGQAPQQGTRAADSSSNMFMDRYLEEGTLAQVQELKTFAEAKGCTVGQLALAWCLRQSNVASVIVGATKVSQLEENAAAADLDFDDEVWAEAERILSAGQLKEGVKV
jgi:voltage-dependent potassium channel beta subunit